MKNEPTEQTPNWQYQTPDGVWHTVEKYTYARFKTYDAFVNHWQVKGYPLREYTPALVKADTSTQENETVDETIYLNINDFSISEEDLERAFCFGWLSNPDNPVMDNQEMMRRYELFKTTYLLPMLTRKHIID